MILLVEMMRRFPLPAFLVLIAVFLAYKNYSPGSYLMGWDSLHPEFNLFEAIRRVFSGVWRQEQGLGAIAAHAHMTELPRLVFVYLSSLFFAPNFIRWLYTFICLALGPLGVFYFLTYVLKREREGLVVYLASFLGAAFYLLNLGTLQHFFVPFEMFPAQFAFLPWLFYYALKILREREYKNFLIFTVLSFLATPMAYAPALFYAYFGGLILFLSAYWVSSRFNRNIFKKSFLIVFMVFAANAFWILPNFYSIKNQSNIVSEAKINKLFSPEAFLRNVDYGNMENVVLQKSFLFDWRAFDFESGTFVDLMETWKNHLSSERILLVGYALFIAAVLGALLTLFKRNKVGIGLLAVSGLCLFFLININYSTGVFYKYLYDNFSVFREGFRLPFTKFSILFGFSLSFFFAYFFFNIFSVLSKKKLTKILVLPLTAVILFGLITFMLPAFKGSLISEVVKTEIPIEYSDLFTWFKGKDGRIAKLPIHTQWGWEYHNWGYEGSGFLTYGLANPLLDRDFDRWSPYNESFFNEASLALYSGDNEAFLKVLQKYQIKYLLLDESIINAGGSPEILYINELKELLSSAGISEAARFGFLAVYETSFGNEFISTPEVFGRFDTDSTYSQIDPVFTSYGDYVNEPEGITFPFINLDRRMGVTVQDLGDRVQIESRDLNFQGTKDITYPDFVFGEKEEVLRVLINTESKAQVSLPIYQKTSADLLSSEQESRFQNCDLHKIGEVKRQIDGGQISQTATNGGVACEFFNFPDIIHSEGYLLHIKGENKEGRGLKIYLQNWQTNRMDLEELLPEGAFDKYFFILPQKEAIEGQIASGYSLNLETRSFGRIASENIIEVIEFIPVPVNWLTQIRLEPQAQELTVNNLSIKNVKKTGTWLYKVETEGEGLLELGQGFEKGWIAFPNNDFKNKLKHVRVNSWANGWEIEEGTNQITIMFWPQILEYLGFGVLGITLLCLLKLHKPKMVKERFP